MFGGLYACQPLESNAFDFWLMTGILENVPAPFESVPTVFCRLNELFVENVGRFLDDFLAFLKLY